MVEQTQQRPMAWEYSFFAGQSVRTACLAPLHCHIEHHQHPCRHHHPFHLSQCRSFRSVLRLRLREVRLLGPLGSVVLDFQHRDVSVWSAPPSLLYGFCKPLTCFSYAQSKMKGAVSSDKSSWYPTRFLTSRLVNHQPNHLHACIQDVRPRLRKARSLQQHSCNHLVYFCPLGFYKDGEYTKKKVGIAFEVFSCTRGWQSESNHGICDKTGANLDSQANMSRRPRKFSISRLVGHG